MILVACDPGLQALSASTIQKSGAFDVYDMPTLEKPLAKRSKKTRTIYNIAEVYALLDMFKGSARRISSSRSRQGGPASPRSAAFNFGFGCGVLRRIAFGLGYSVEPVAPSVWKAEMKCPSDNSKVIRARANELLPHHAHLWPLVKHDGRAEAAMLALWGERKLERVDNGDQESQALPDAERRCCSRRKRKPRTRC